MPATSAGAATSAAGAGMSAAGVGSFAAVGTCAAAGAGTDSAGLAAAASVPWAATAGARVASAGVAVCTACTAARAVELPAAFLTRTRLTGCAVVAAAAGPPLLPAESTLGPSEGEVGPGDVAGELLGVRLLLLLRLPDPAVSAGVRVLGGLDELACRTP